MQAVIWAHEDVRCAMGISALGTAALSAIALKVVSATAPVKALLVVAAAALNYAAFYVTRGWAFRTIMCNRNSFNEDLIVRMASQGWILASVGKELVKEALLLSLWNVADSILKKCPKAARGFDDDTDVLKVLISQTSSCNTFYEGKEQFRYLRSNIVCGVLDGSPNLAMKKFEEHDGTTTILHKAICANPYVNEVENALIIIKKVLEVCPKAVNIKNSDGQTPYEYALERFDPDQHREIVALLKPEGYVED